MPYTQTPLGGRNIWTGQEADNAANMRFSQNLAAQQALAEMQAQIAREQMAGQERMQGVDIGARERMHGAGLSAEERMLGTRGQQQLDAIRAGQAPQMAGLDFAKQQYADQASMRQLEQQRAQAEWAAQEPMLRLRGQLMDRVGQQFLQPGAVDLTGGDQEFGRQMMLGLMNMEGLASSRARAQEESAARNRAAIQKALDDIQKIEDPEERARRLAMVVPLAQGAGVLPAGVAQEAFMPSFAPTTAGMLTAEHSAIDREIKETPWYDAWRERIYPQGWADAAKLTLTGGPYALWRALGGGDTEAERDKQAFGQLQDRMKEQPGGTEAEKLNAAYMTLPDEVRERLAVRPQIKSILERLVRKPAGERTITQ